MPISMLDCGITSRNPYKGGARNFLGLTHQRQVNPRFYYTIRIQPRLDSPGLFCIIRPTLLFFREIHASTLSLGLTKERVRSRTASLKACMREFPQVTSTFEVEPPPALTS